MLIAFKCCILAEHCCDLCKDCASLKNKLGSSPCLNVNLEEYEKYDTISLESEASKFVMSFKPKQEAYVVSIIDQTNVNRLSSWEIELTMDKLKNIDVKWSIFEGGLKEVVEFIKLCSTQKEFNIKITEGRLTLTLFLSLSLTGQKKEYQLVLSENKPNIEDKFIYLGAKIEEIMEMKLKETNNKERFKKLFKLNAGQFILRTTSWTDFIGGAGSVYLENDIIYQWHLVINGHWTDASPHQYMRFRLKIQNDNEKNNSYLPSEDGVVKLMFPWHSRHESYTEIDTFKIEKSGKYNVNLQVQSPSAEYNWNSLYGTVSLFFNS